MKKPTSPGPLTLGNVRFDPVTTNTVERELVWTQLVHRAQLGSLLPRPGESFVQYAEHVRRRLMLDGVYLEFLAMHLAPQGRPWSAAQMPHVAEFLGYVSAPLDRMTLKLLLLRVVNELMDCGALARWHPVAARRGGA